MMFHPPLKSQPPTPQPPPDPPTAAWAVQLIVSQLSTISCDVRRMMTSQMEDVGSELVAWLASLKVCPGVVGVVVRF